MAHTTVSAKSWGQTSLVSVPGLVTESESVPADNPGVAADGRD
jgi:hypothetical protein